mgnify:FL=1
MRDERPFWKSPGWIILPVGLAVGVVAVTLLNRPVMERVDTARRDLALAGYPGAEVSRIQIPNNMARCDVSQVGKNRGYAYGWQTDAHSGVFCFPTDGRPTRVLLD